MKTVYLRSTIDLLWSIPDTKEKAEDIINKSEYKKIKSDTIDYFIISE